MFNLMMFHWSPDPIFLSIGVLKVHWYGMFWLTAFLGGEAIAKYEFKFIGRSDIDTSNLMICALIGTIVGARLAHCVFYDPIYYFSHPLKVLAIWEGGMASHGGVIGFVVGLKLGMTPFGKGLSLLTLLDAAAIPAALGGALVRFANFVNSEIVGIPTEGRFGVTFDRIDNLPRHPVQLYEALAYLSVFITLLMLFRKSMHRFGRGTFLGWFMVSVFSMRFLLEFLKIPQASYEAGFSVSVGQLLSVPFVLIGVGLLVYAHLTSNQHSSVYSGDRDR